MCIYTYVPMPKKSCCVYKLTHTVSSTGVYSTDKHTEHKIGALLCCACVRVLCVHVPEVALLIVVVGDG